MAFQCLAAVGSIIVYLSASTYLFGIAFALTALTVTGAFAQTTGNLLGQVTDPDSVSLPGVTVTLTSDNLIQSRSAVSDVEGTYRFPSIPVGRYDISFSPSPMLSCRSTPEPRGCLESLAWTAASFSKPMASSNSVIIRLTAS